MGINDILGGFIWFLAILQVLLFKVEFWIPVFVILIIAGCCTFATYPRYPIRRIYKIITLSSLILALSFVFLSSKIRDDMFLTSGEAVIIEMLLAMTVAFFASAAGIFIGYVLRRKR